ncbi:MAG: Flp pilus assembly protein CpaB [Marinosulfonomonas sp.]|nr:Flp pilus assembly protein CpaB [Marinosulfonomonas sp.]
MGIRSVLVAVLGVAVAGGSAFGAREYLNDAKATAAATPQSSLVTVVVAGRDIPFGQAIQPQMLHVISWPSDAVPPGAITDVNSLIAKAGQPLRRAKREFSQGELILASKISDFGDKVTIVQSLGPNARAVAIKVDAVTAVGGFVTPGDTVDIVLTQGRAASLRAVTILQNIRIIGVDQDTNEQNDQPGIARTVTVEVSPEQGQKLALAQKAGTLSLTLRTLDDVRDEPMDSIRLSDLMRDKSPVEEAVSKTTIRVRRGSNVEEVEVN